MPRINLLPWREQQRTDRKKAFGVGLGAAALAALALAGLGYFFFGQMIESQQARNEMLRGEIKKLDKQIEQINSLETQKQQMIARMRIIEKLQQSRHEIVHVFDSFPRVLPDGMYLTSIKQTEQKFKIQGYSQAASRPADLFANISSSEWLKDAEIGEIVEKPLGYEFNLTAVQRSPATEEAEAAEKAKAAKDKKKP